MYKKINLLWNQIIKHLENVNNDGITINKNSYALFENVFCEMYDHVKNVYMDKSVNYLDRHKVGAIIIYSLLRVPVINYISEKADEIEIKKYQLALSAGLSYMQYELNHSRVINHEKPIDKYTFPPIMYGDISYKDNLIRLLYFEDKEKNYNVLSLAHLLFFIETYSLL